MNCMKVATELFLIDSTILVYAYDPTDKHKYAIAKALLEKCWQKEKTYAISAQNLGEFFIVITKKVPYPLPIIEAQQIIADICAFSGWQVLHYDAHTLQNAIDLYKHHQKHFWDALIVATMRQEGITHIYTENESDFKVFQNITVINPFRT